jgi:Fe2+ or Zn2+ uptake regulation protein
MYDQTDYFKELCRQKGWRCTIQRRMVYNYLIGNHLHPDVEMVWTNVRRQLPDVSLDSIYRILADFADARIVRRLESGKNFRYDINTDPHEHFVCTECGNMFDVPLLEGNQIMAKCGVFGKVVSFELEVRGICKDCLATGKGVNPPAPQEE